MAETEKKTRSPRKKAVETIPLAHRDGSPAGEIPAEQIASLATPAEEWDQQSKLLQATALLGPYVETADVPGLFINFGLGPVATMSIPSDPIRKVIVHLVQNGGQTRHEIDRRTWALLEARFDLIRNSQAKKPGE